MAPDNALNERERLNALRATGLLDSDPEQAYDDIAQLAAHLCGTPIGLISLVEENRQWFKARVGIDATETSREVSFCSHAIQRPEEIMIVPDATKDDRFRGNPLVTGGPEIRFYAGVPLQDAEGRALGALCVIDSRPRELPVEQEQALKALSRQFTQLLRLRESNRRLEQEIEERKRLEAKLVERAETYLDLVENAGDIIQSVGTEGEFLYVNAAWRTALGYSNEEALAMNAFQVLAPEYHESCLQHLRAVMAGANLDAIKVAFLTKTGERVDVVGHINARVENGRTTATRGIFRIVHADLPSRLAQNDARSAHCICGWCKQMRDSDGRWRGLENYLVDECQLPLTHNICPNCSDKLMSELEVR